MSVSQPDSRRPALRHDERAVSEVVGQILTLGILSMLLIASLWGFAAAKDNATERAVTVRGDAMLNRISSTAVHAALFAEGHPNSSVQYEGLIDLPHELEGHPYLIDLDTDEVFIEFPNFATSVSAPLFRADAGNDITVCDQDAIPGGPVLLILQEAGNLDSVHPCYVEDSTTLVLYLETDS